MPAPLPLVHELHPPPDVAETLSRFADWPNVVLFDSASRRPELGRYSFLTADPIEFEELANVPFGTDPFTRLRTWSHQFCAPSVPDLPPFQGGIAGLLSYELGGAWERLPRPAVDEFDLPWLAVGLYDWVIAWDHAQHRAWVISHGFPASEANRERRAAERQQSVLARLGAATTAAEAESKILNRRAEISSPQNPLPGLAGLSSNFSKEAYLRVVERVIEYIRAGDIFQVNLSQRLLAPLTEHPLDLYGRLREQIGRAHV